MRHDTILAWRSIFEGWFDVVLTRLSIGGSETERALVIHPSGVCVLAYDRQRRVACVVRETRLAVLWHERDRLYEAVAGVVEPGEDPVAAVIREAREEVGIALRDPEPIGHVWMTPSSTTETVRLFLAEYGSEQRLSPGGGIPAEQEWLEVEEVPLPELWHAIGTGGIIDAKLYMLLHALRLKSPDLFEEIRSV